MQPLVYYSTVQCYTVYGTVHYSTGDYSAGYSMVKHYIHSHHTIHTQLPNKTWTKEDGIYRGKVTYKYFTGIFYLGVNIMYSCYQDTIHKIITPGS